MRLLTVAVCVAAMFVSSGSVWAQDTGSCEDVSCAGHGKCVVKGGEPVCACDEGYQADSVGLSCVPLVAQPPAQTSVAPAATENGISPIPEGKECAWDVHCRRPRRCDTDMGRCLSRTMRRAFDSDGMNFKLMRIFGSIFTIGGGAVIAAGLVLAFAGTSAGDPNIEYLIFFLPTGGGIALFVGLPLLITGVVGGNRYQEMKPSIENAETKLRFSPSLAVTRNSGTVGLSATF